MPVIFYFTMLTSPGLTWTFGGGDDLRDLNIRRDLRIAIRPPFHCHFGPFFPDEVAHLGVDHVPGFLTHRSLHLAIEPCNRSMLVEPERLLYAVVETNDEHILLWVDAYQLAR